MLACKRKMKHLIRSNVLLTSTILAVCLGLALGFILRPLHLSDTTCLLINFPGEIFMQVLKMMILPLIFSSLISALAQMDWKQSGQIGLATVGYYFVTAILATVIGISLVLAIHPGDPDASRDLIDDSVDDADVYPLDTFLDLLRNMFPQNILQATFQRVQTKYFAARPIYKQINETVSPGRLIKQLQYAHGTNIMGVIVFCTGFGMVISKLGEKASIVIEFFVILDAVIMRWVEAVMWFAPIGIVCLIVGNLLELDDLGDTAQMLFMYLLTVLTGLAIHTVIVMPGIYFLITRKNPMTVVHEMLQALVTAFGTASSGAALPMSMQCLENKLHVDRRIARFVLPLGTTINMDGSALYEAVAVIFIAQLNNVSLSLAEVITISLIATIASIGLGSVPAGLVSIFVILNTVGLPTKDIPLLFTIDWLIDRIRTMINVLGDGYVASALAHLLNDKLENADKCNQFRAELKEEIEQFERCRAHSAQMLSSSASPPRKMRRHSISIFPRSKKFSWRSSVLQPRTSSCQLGPPLPRVELI